MVGIPFAATSVSSSASSFAASSVSAGGDCEGDTTPRVDASSSAAAAAAPCSDAPRRGETTVPSSWTTVGVDACACDCESLSAFCIRYSSSMTNTELLVFRSSSQPIWETSRVRSEYARAHVPRRPGAGRRRSAGSAFGPPEWECEGRGWVHTHLVVLGLDPLRQNLHDLALGGKVYAGGREVPVRVSAIVREHGT